MVQNGEEAADSFPFAVDLVTEIVGPAILFLIDGPEFQLDWFDRHISISPFYVPGYS